MKSLLCSCCRLAKPLLKGAEAADAVSHLRPAGLQEFVYTEPLTPPAQPVDVITLNSLCALSPCLLCAGLLGFCSCCQAWLPVLTLASVPCLPPAQSCRLPGRACTMQSHRRAAGYSCSCSFHSTEQQPVCRFYEPGQPSYMRDHVAYTVLQQAGAPYAFTSYVHLRLNGQFYGLYLMTEYANQQYIEVRKVLLPSTAGGQLALTYAACTLAARASLTAKCSCSLQQAQLQAHT